MGVKGLQTYVEALGISQIARWSMDSCTINGKPASPSLRNFSIDGLSLICTIAAKYSDLMYGGDYYQFSQRLERFLHDLLECGIKPVIFLDGALPEYKSEQRIERDTECIKRAALIMASSSKAIGPDMMLLPPLLLEVALHTLRRMQATNLLNVKVCPFEADALVANHAKKTGGVVLGLDSDYFIFDPSFYAPLNSFEIKNYGGHKYATANIFAQHILAQKLGPIPPSFLPIFSALVGNDYVSPSYFTSILFPRGTTTQRIPSSRRINGAAVYLSRLKDMHLKELIAHIKSYSSDPQKTIRLLQTSLDAYTLVNLSTESMMSSSITFRSHDVLFNQRFDCHPSLEDVTREPAHLMSREIRQWAYGFINTRSFPSEGFSFVNEFIRRSHHISQEEVEPVDGNIIIQAIANHGSAEDMPIALIIDRFTDWKGKIEFSYVSLFLRVFVIMCKRASWLGYRGSFPFRHELISLIISMLIDGDDQLNPALESKREYRSAHLLSQFQATVQSIILLIQAISMTDPRLIQAITIAKPRFDLVNMPDLPRILPNGRVFHACVEKLRAGLTISNVLNWLNAGNIEKQVIAIESIVKEGVEKDIVAINMKKEAKISTKPPLRSSYSSNSFDLLSTDEN